MQSNLKSIYAREHHERSLNLIEVSSALHDFANQFKNTHGRCEIAGCHKHDAEWITKHEQLHNNLQSQPRTLKDIVLRRQLYTEVPSAKVRNGNPTKKTKVPTKLAIEAFTKILQKPE